MAETTTQAGQPTKFGSGFVFYLAARLVSIAGAAATTVIVPVFVYQITGSAALTGVIGGIGGLTYFAFGIPVGHLVDRFPRGPVLVACSVARSLLIISIPVVTAAGNFHIAYLLVVLVLTNVLFVATDAANAGALRALVGREGILRANSVVSGAASIVETGAPLAAGAALAVISAPNVFFIEGIALLLSAVLLWFLRRRLDTPRTTSPRASWRAAFSGFVFIWRERPVRWTTAGALVFAVAEGVIIGQLVVFLTQRFGAESSAPLLGWAYASIAVGSLVGSWFVVRLPFSTRPIPLSALALVGSALILVAVIVVPGPVATIALIGVWAIPYMIVFVGATATRQARAADEMQGRVAVGGRLLTLGAGVPAGSFLGGITSQATNAQDAFLLAAIILALGAAAGLALSLTNPSPQTP